MASLVYLLCAITSLICASLLLRSYLANRTPLLFWSSLCFIGLALNNILLFVDLVIVPTIDLSLYRTLCALIGVFVLVFGLIWENE
jgi:uncharacterized protein DUF5985